MGGGVSRHELAAAVSAAGGLGTIAVNGEKAIERELARARQLTDRPIAANLLLPFARRGWFEAAAKADVVVTFWGPAEAACAGDLDPSVRLGCRGAGGLRCGRRRSDRPGRPRPAGTCAEVWAPWSCSIGSRRSCRPSIALLLAGGSPSAVTSNVPSRRAPARPRRHPLPALRREPRPPGVQAATLDARRRSSPSCLSPAGRHRIAVVANAATERWLVGDRRGPSSTAPSTRPTSPGARYMPASIQTRIALRQRPGSRLLSPQGPIDDGPAGLLDAGPLYAGETVARIADVRPAAKIVSDLTPS